MKRLFGLACLLILALTNAAWAQNAAALREGYIRLSLPSDEIFRGEAVILQIEYVGPEKESLDLTPLKQVGDFGRETFGTRLRVVNGEVVEMHTHRIEITPRELGLAVFGPLHGTGEAAALVSNTLRVEVLEPRRAAWRPTDQDIRLTQKVTGANPWLQQQMILDIELGYRYPLSEEKLELPDFSGFRVAPVFVQQRSQGRDAEGNPWATISWRYLLFPQRSGPQKVTGARFTGTVAKSRVDRAIVDLIGQETPISVKRAEFPAAQWWLVADSLTLTEEWIGDPAAFAAGEEIERRLIVTAKGALAEQIPDVEMPNVAGLDVARIGHKRVNRISEEGAEGTATFRYRLRALRPGPVVLETIRLRWWNGAEGRVGEGLLPPRRLEIAEARIGAEAEASDPGLAAGAWRKPGALGLLGLEARFGIGAVLAAVLGLLIWSLSRRRRAEGPAADLLARIGAAEAALRARDSAAAHEALRALTREAGAGPEAGALRLSFEEAAHAGAAPDWEALKAGLKALRRSLSARAKASAPGLLPPL